jgi:hypothetical protein
MSATKRIKPTPLSEALPGVQAHYHKLVSKIAAGLAKRILSNDLSDDQAVSEAIDEDVVKATGTDIECQEIILASPESSADAIKAGAQIDADDWKAGSSPPWGKWAQATLESDVKDELIETHGIDCQQPEKARKAKAEGQKDADHDAGRVGRRRQTGR